MKIFVKFLKWDGLLIWRQKGWCLSGVSFVMLSSMLLVFVLNPELPEFTNVALGMFWIIALFLAINMSGQVFGNDYLDGELERIVAHSIPLEWLALAKIVLLGGVLFLILLVTAGIFFELFHVKQFGFLSSIFALFLGAISLSALSVLAGALMLGTNGHRFFIHILLMPLFVPVLIFAHQSMTKEQLGSWGGEPLLYLLAWTIGFIPLCVIATAVVLRLAVQND